MARTTKPEAVADEVRQYEVQADDDGIRLDRWFKRHLPDIPFSLVSRWARTGQLRVDGARADVGDRIAAGQAIRVPPAEAPRERRAPQSDPLTAAEIEQAQAMVIHKDRAAIVLNKPPGLATQGGTKTSAHVDRLLAAFVEDEEPKPKLVHRLDKDTSGVLLVGRTAGAAAHFSKQFSGRRTKKIYWALVMGLPDIADGIVELPLAKQPGSGGEKMHVDEENGQPSKTRYRVVERIGNRAAWVELQPYTGRTHQLRVHMAAIGHPIVGDGKYGGKDAFLTGSISRKMHLHARRLRIPHPDGGALDISADLPLHMAESFSHLGLDMASADKLLDDEAAPLGREEKKQKARAHAKQVRKERRGERKARGPADPKKPGKRRLPPGKGRR